MKKYIITDEKGQKRIIHAVCIEDAINKMKDMAVSQLKPEVNLGKLSVAITNKDKITIMAMEGIIRKDVDDYNYHFMHDANMSISDKIMVVKKYVPLLDKVHRLGLLLDINFANAVKNYNK